MTDATAHTADPYVPPDDGKRRRNGYILRIVVIVVAALVLAALVYGVSQAAFSGSTSVRGNVSTGSVVLGNNTESSTIFAVSNLNGGETFEACVHVTYDGSITPAPIVLHSSDADADGGLATYLDLTVEMGSGKEDIVGDTSCTGFQPEAEIAGGTTFAGFIDTHGSFEEALDTGWTAAAAGESKDFRFTLTVQDNNDAQSKSSQPVFTWETRP